MLFVTKKAGICEEMASLKAANFILGLIIIGVEGGYMLMYRNGWEISKGSIMANISIAIILLFIGSMFFHEKINMIKVIGIIVCLLGIALVNAG